MAEATAKDNFLNADFSEQDTIWLSQQKTLRKLVGILGMSLPILLVVFLYVDDGHWGPLPSISHYYYTRVGSIFIIIVSLLAIFLLIYKGKERTDLYLSSIAGLFALCLLLFPTDNLSKVCCDPGYSVTILKISGFRATLHYVASAIFLGCLAAMSLFVFTKSDKPAAQRSRGKKIRNRIFIVCGVLMIVALLTVAAGLGRLIPASFYNTYHLTFWMETLAIESFGLSWLIKSEAIIKD